MPEFKLVVRHARHWRGNLHKWSTAHSLVGSASLSGTTLVDAYSAAESAMCYQPSAPDPQGTIWECQLYESGVSTPVETNTYCDPDDPSSWIAYSAFGWTPGGFAREFEPVAEPAMLLVWPAGLGRTGKPVYFRHWIHAVPVSASIDGAPDIGGTDHAHLVTQAGGYVTAASAHGLALGNSRRLVDTSNMKVATAYENHQMPRGRRRKA